MRYSLGQIHAMNYVCSMKSGCIFKYLNTLMKGVLALFILNFVISNSVYGQSGYLYTKTIELSFLKSIGTLSFDFDSIPPLITSDIKISIEQAGAHKYTFSQVVCGTQQIVCGTQQVVCGTEQVVCGSEQVVCGQDQYVCGTEQVVCGSYC